MEAIRKLRAAQSLSWLSGTKTIASVTIASVTILLDTMLGKIGLCI